VEQQRDLSHPSKQERGGVMAFRILVVTLFVIVVGYLSLSQ